MVRWRRSNISSTQAYASSLATNTSALLSLAFRDLPAFGVDPASIRSIALNSSSATQGSTAYILTVQYTVILGSTASFRSPLSAFTGSGSGRRRRVLLQAKLEQEKGAAPLCPAGVILPLGPICSDEGLLAQGVSKEVDTPDPSLPPPLTVALSALSLLVRTLRAAAEPALTLAEDLVDDSLLAAGLDQGSGFTSRPNVPHSSLTAAEDQDRRLGRRRLMDNTSPGDCGSVSSLALPDPSVSNITALATPSTTCQTPGITQEGLLLSTIMGAVTATVDASAAIQVGS